MKKQIKGLNTMKKIIAPLTAVALIMTGCDVDKSINDNPNEITLKDVDARLFLNGAQLANIIVQVSHLNRISGMFSGQLVGFTSLYSNIYGYSSMPHIETITIGSTIPRDLNIPGRDLQGVHFAMEFLTQQNRVNSGQIIPSSDRISAEGKRVLILGGGDTGSDCLGTAIRQGAEIVYQYELVSEPPEERRSSNPWPDWPLILRTSTSQEEGGERDYDILTSKFTGNNKIEKMYAQKVSWGPPDETGRPKMSPLSGSEFEMDVDLVLLAMGFIHPQHEGIVNELGLELDPRGNILTNENKSTSVPNVFAAGDSSRGQSLVVWALAEGREVARQIDLSLMGKTQIRPVLQ